jgi:hypothetical protein
MHEHPPPRPPIRPPRVTGPPRVVPFAFCLLPFAFCLLPLVPAVLLSAPGCQTHRRSGQTQVLGGGLCTTKTTSGRFVSPLRHTRVATHSLRFSLVLARPFRQPQKGHSSFRDYVTSKQICIL